MKKINKYLSILAVTSILFIGCTKTMNDMNLDPKENTNNGLLADGVACQLHITNMLKNLFNLNTSWEYQVQQNLNADIFAGYTTPPVMFGSTTPNDNYTFNDGWNGWALTVAQANFTEFLALKNLTVSGKNNSSYYAAGQILNVLTALPLVDGFGPFPYLQYGIGSNPVWNNVDSIYRFGFLPQLVAARDTFEHIIASGNVPPIQTAVPNSDISSFGGNSADWIKLANTLILRLSLRISNVDLADANNYAAVAISDKNGFVNTTSGDWYIDCTPGNTNGVTNPFYFLSTSWDNCSMSADMQSFLVGFQDPRISAFFLPCTDSTITANYGAGIFAGIRPGSNHDGGLYSNYSLLNVPNHFLLVSSAESYFLLAEAYLRGIGVSASNSLAQTNYEAGITASFSALNVGGVASYIQSTNTPANYIDYDHPTYNYNATTSITPKWDATGVTSLEQIITQKWIAMFPKGEEAWAEFRRTGFPKLEIPYNMAGGNNGDGTVIKNHFITRMPYPSNFLSLSPVQSKSAIESYLNGVDNASSLLWWETVQQTSPSAK